MMSVYTNDVDSLRQMISTAMAEAAMRPANIIHSSSKSLVASLRLVLRSIFINYQK